MTIVTIHTAKSTLSQLIARAEAGEEIIIARGKEPVAKLVPLQPGHGRRFGALAGQIHVDPDILEPLSEDELEGWE